LDLEGFYSLSTLTLWTMDWNAQAQLSIVVAGNTAPRCLFALAAKGYDLLIEYHQQADGGYLPGYRAHKEERFFTADSPEALLGLVAMWEMRGDGWQESTYEEWQFLDKLEGAAVDIEEEGEEQAEG